MKLIIRNTSEAASRYVAQLIIDRIRSFDPLPDRPFVLGLPTGSSPEFVYKCLVQAYQNDEVSFANVVTFNMDEYVDLPEEHPESYHSFMFKHFFAHIDINPANVHLLNGNAPDLLEECARYERKIAEAGGIQLFLGGIGPDGHVAFNEPGSALNSHTRVVTLAEDTLRANSRFFNNDTTHVPKQALTVGVQTIMDAQEVVLIVTGAHKAAALQKTVEGGVSQMWTASALQLHENVTLACDDAATEEMLVKTIKYFKSIEQIENELQQTFPPRQSVTSSTKHWRAALNGLRLDTTGKPRTVDPDELTPDSMSSRLNDSAVSIDMHGGPSSMDKMPVKLSVIALGGVNWM